LVALTTPDGSWTYAYDDDGQLTQAAFTSTNPNIADQDLAYSYDPNGNSTSTVINGVTTNYTVNSMNEYTSIGGIPQEYDANGNLLFDGTTSYTYNRLNQLTGFSNAQGTAQFTSNALGERVSSDVNGVITQFLNDPDGTGTPTAEYNASGQLITHINQGFGVVSQTTASGASYFYDSDLTGSVAGLTDQGGSYVDSYAYLPFGQLIASSGTVANPFQFQGDEMVQTDAPNLLSMGVREYSASDGRFISTDPLQIVGGNFDFYTYAYNQPLQFDDPSGLTSLAGRKAGGSFDTSEFGQEFIAFEFGGLTVKYAAQQPDGYLLVNPPWANQDLGKLTINGLRLAVPPTTTMGAGGGKAEFSEFGFREPEVFKLGLLDELAPIAPAGAGAGANSTISSSFNPNDKIGPGYGPEGFVAADADLSYRVDFENASTATAPAQQVVVTDQLSTDDNWSTFRVTEAGWGDTVLVARANSQHFETTVPVTIDGNSFDVLVEIGISLVNGLVTARFYSIDPATGLPPDGLVGFLPPEDGTGRGMGYFSYTVMPVAGLPTGTQIRNVANVSFDEEPIIPTDQVSDTDPTQGTDPSKQALVTIDAGPPTSAVTALPAVTPTTSFTVSWSGQDDPGGSGIASYNIYVSDDGGPYTLFTSSDSAGSAPFTGQNGHTYAFYSIATDNVGNQEAVKSVPDTSTTVTVPVAETWSRGGADDNWSTGANWTSLAAPNAGESLVFQGAVQTTTNNDLPAGTLLQSITLAAPGFVLGGNAVTLASASGPVVTLAAASGTIQLPITLGSDATFAVTDPQGSLTDSGDIDNGGHSLTFDTNSSQSSRLSGSISGVSGFIKSGSGEIVLSGTNSFSGGTQVLAGSLVVAATGALPDGTSLTVGSGGTFIFDPSQSASNLSSAGLTAPVSDTAAASETSTPVVAAGALANGPVSASAPANVVPFSARHANHLLDFPVIASPIAATSSSTSEMPVDTSRVTVDAVFTTHRSAFDLTVSPADNAHSVIPWAWLGAIESSWNSSDRNKTTDWNVAALDEVLAGFGV
jgi:RHS repeat-associated protein